MRNVTFITIFSFLSFVCVSNSLLAENSEDETPGEIKNYDPSTDVYKWNDQDDLKNIPKDAIIEIKDDKVIDTPLVEKSLSVKSGITDIKSPVELENNIDIHQKAKIDSSSSLIANTLENKGKFDATGATEIIHDFNNEKNGEVTSSGDLSADKINNNGGDISLEGSGNTIVKESINNEEGGGIKAASHLQADALENKGKFEVTGATEIIHDFNNEKNGEVTSSGDLSTDKINNNGGDISLEGSGNTIVKGSINNEEGGIIKAASHLQADALENKGKFEVTGATEIIHDFNNEKNGEVTSSGDLSTDKINNNGGDISLEGSGNTIVKGSINNEEGGIIKAASHLQADALENKGKFDVTGATEIIHDFNNEKNGEVTSSGDLSANKINNNGGDISLEGSGNTIVKGSINNEEGGIIKAASHLQADALENKGKFDVTGATEIIHDFNNEKNGEVTSSGDLSADKINNNGGDISLEGSGNTIVKGSINNEEGGIIKAASHLQADALENKGKFDVTGATEIIHDFNNEKNGEVTSSGDLSTDKINNNGGDISLEGSGNTIVKESINNEEGGVIKAASHLQADALENKGKFDVTGATEIIHDFNNEKNGEVTSSGDLSTDKINNNGGDISLEGSGNTIVKESINNEEGGVIKAASHLQADALENKGKFDVTGATEIIHDFNNEKNGEVTSSGDLSANKINNNGGDISLEGSGNTIVKESINNEEGGGIKAASHLQADALENKGKFDVTGATEIIHDFNNEKNGEVTSSGDLSADKINNNGGDISLEGSGNTIVKGSINNEEGGIIKAASHLQADALENKGKFDVTGATEIIHDFNNEKNGEVTSSGDLSADKINNNGGDISLEGSGNTIVKGSINNEEGGIIKAASHLQADALENKGKFDVTGATEIIHDFNNEKNGEVTSSGDLSADKINNNGGDISLEGSGNTIVKGSINNEEGGIIKAASHLQADALENKGKFDVTGATEIIHDFNNEKNGEVTSSGDLSANKINNNGGDIALNGNTTIQNSINNHEGNLFINGPTYVKHDVNIDEGGALKVNKDLHTSKIKSSDDGKITGTGRIDLQGGKAELNGVTAPGNSPGTLTIEHGDVIFGPDHTLNIAVEGNDYSKLVVSDGKLIADGHINIDGKTTIGTDFHVVQTDPDYGTEGHIDSVSLSDDSPGLRGRAVVSDDGIHTLIAPTDYRSMAETENQRQVAGALNHLMTVSTPIAISIDRMTAAEYANALEQSSPTLYQSLSTTAFNSANAQNQELIQRLAGIRLLDGQGGSFQSEGSLAEMPCYDDKSVKLPDNDKDILQPSENNHWGVFADGDGIFAKANSGGNLPTYNIQSGGITTGATYQWNKNVSTGAYTGYQGTYNKYNQGTTLVDNALNFGLFGTYGSGQGKGFFVDGLVGAIYDNYAVSRSIQFSDTDVTATSSPTAGEFNSMLATGYDIKKGHWSFGPLSSLQYIYFSGNQFDESGASDLNIDAHNWNTSSMIYSLGGRCSYTWQLNKHLCLAPQGSLSWQHEFMQNPYTITANFEDNPTAFQNWSNTPLRDSLYTGAGVSLNLDSKWDCSFFYNTVAGNKDIMSQNFFLSAGMKF